MPPFGFEPYPSDPLTFRAQNGRAHVSRNTTRICVMPGCGLTPGNGIPLSALKTCKGCKKVWYCSHEHQREDWPRHKAMCKQHQGHIKMLHELDATRPKKIMPCGHPAPPLFQQKDMTEDFVKIHKRAFAKAIGAMLVRTRGVGCRFDAINECVQIGLRYNHGCDQDNENKGNPAMAYDIETVFVWPLDESPDTVRDQMRKYARVTVLPNLAACRALKKKSRIIDIIPCSFVDHKYGLPYSTSIELEELDYQLPASDIAEKKLQWWTQPAFNARTGLVWRRFEKFSTEGPHKVIDVPGKLVRKGEDEWEWCEMSEEEVRWYDL